MPDLKILHPIEPVNGCPSRCGGVMILERGDGGKTSYQGTEVPLSGNLRSLMSSISDNPQG